MVFKEKELPLRDKDLPVLIREVVSNAPQNRKLPSFIACLSPLCALATRIRLKYDYDSRPSALLLQVIIEAPQSSGKQFAADIERLLLDDTLKARDQEQRRLEQEYREKKKRRKANEKLEEEPKTTIRTVHDCSTICLSSSPATSSGPLCRTSISNLFAKPLYTLNTIH